MPASMFTRVAVAQAVAFPVLVSANSAYEPAASGMIGAINALLASKVVPSLNSEIPWHVHKDHLEPLPKVISEPILQLGDLSGLSAAVIESLEATSVDDDDDDSYKVDLTAKIKVDTTMTAKGNIGEAPEAIPVTAELTNGRMTFENLRAHVDKNSWTIETLDVKDMKIDYDDLIIKSENTAVQGMLTNVAPKYKKEVEKWLVHSLKKPVQHELNSFVPISMLGSSEDEDATEEESKETSNEDIEGEAAKAGEAEADLDAIEDEEDDLLEEDEPAEEAATEEPADEAELDDTEEDTPVEAAGEVEDEEPSVEEGAEETADDDTTTVDEEDVQTVILP